MALLAVTAVSTARPAQAQTVPAGYAITPFVTGLPSSPSQLTDDPATGTLYFANNSGALYSVSSAGAVARPSTNITSGDLNPYQWTDIEFAADAVYITTSNHLDKFDLTTNTASHVSTALSGFGNECGMATIGHVLYITSGNNTTDKMDTYDLSTNMLATVNSSLPSRASSLQYDPVSGKLYFACVAAGTFYQYDPVGNTYALVATETNGSDANFAVDPAGQHLYVRVSGGVDQITIADGTITHFATGLPGGPTDSDVTFGPSSSGSGWSLYVASSTSIYEIASFPGPAAPTTTALVSSANPSVFGQPVTYTATVTGGDGGGTVQFAFDGADVGSPVALTGGVATYTGATLAPGSHAVTAVYSGDSASATSTANVTQVVNQADTTTTVSLSANPATDIQPLTVTATVAAVAPGAGTPTGMVQFALDGTNVGQPVALLSGVAAYQYPGGLVLPGSHTVTAVYSGDTDFLADAPGQATEVLTPSAATHFTVTAPVTATASNPISVTVTALDSLGQTATGYTGTVHLTSTDAQAALPADAALTNGVGQFTLTLKTAGTQTVTATDTVAAALTGASGNISVSATMAGQIAFVQQPTTTVAGASITPPPSVAVSDIFGNPIAGASVTVSLVAGTGALSGTATQTTDATGVAAFPGLAISRPGQKTLQAVSGTSLAAASNPFTVTADDTLTAQGVDFSAIKRAPFTAAVAAVTDTDAASPASDLRATIDWGDGATSAGTVSGSAGSFTVAGSHTYAAEGTYSVTTTLTDTQPGGPTAHTTATATVQDVTSPTTTAALNPAAPDGSNGDYTGPVVVTLTATDPDDTASGITTFYAIDGAAPQTYTQPFTVGSAGSHTVTYFSRDASGNTETARSGSFTIQLAPAVLHTFPAGLQLFSVPKDFSGIALGTALSQINPRLWSWEPAAVQYTLAANMAPGQGYWARFGGATALYDLGTPTPTGQPFAIALQKGWNMIGDPFPGGVPLSGVRVQGTGGPSLSLGDANKAGLVALTFYSFPAGSSQYQTEDQNGSLAPYQGYWLYAFQNCTLEVPAP